jgi:protease-4
LENETTSNNNNTSQIGIDQDILSEIAKDFVKEKRSKRRWGIFFKVAFLLYLLAILVVISRQGSGLMPEGDFTAMVSLEGLIAPGTQASASVVLQGLRDAYESEAKGIILQVNSPGGTVGQSAAIHDGILRLKEEFPDTPIHTAVADLCASGGYYAAVATENIYARPSSIVGSIGVLMDMYGFTGTLDKLGVERRLLTAGSNKGMLDPFSPVNPEHTAHAQGILDEMHQQFIDVVQTGRGDRLASDPDIFSGLYWVGSQAVDLGLIDDFLTPSQIARDVIGAEKLVDFTPQKTLLEQFSSQFGVVLSLFGITTNTSVAMRGMPMFLPTSASTL